MSKLSKIKKDIDKGLPALGNILDDTTGNLPNKADRFVNAVIKGINGFFSPEKVFQ